MTIDHVDLLLTILVIMILLVAHNIQDIRMMIITSSSQAQVV